MPEAVIVATARSPIGQAVKGSLASIRPDDLSVQIVNALLEKVPQLPKDQIMPEFTNEVLKQRGLTVPLAKIVAQPPESYPEGGIKLPANWRK